MKFEFPVEDFMVKASGFQSDGKFYLSGVKIFLDDENVTDTLDLPYLIAFEHLATERGNDNIQTNVG